MTRLTTRHRETLLKAVLEHRFAEELTALCDERAAIADAVYADVYSTKIAQQLAALPEGWLPVADRIRVRFGAEDISLNFSGHIWGLDVRRESRLRRVPFNARGSIVKAYEATHPLAVRFEAHAAKVAACKEAHQQAEVSTKAALRQFTSVKSLLQGWPEIEPFVAKLSVSGRIRTLPAVQTEALNHMLNLPAPEAA